MISDELLERYNIDKNYFIDNLKILYETFLIQTDYVACKIAEAQFFNVPIDEDYTEILQARKCPFPDKIDTLNS